MTWVNQRTGNRPLETIHGCILSQSSAIAENQLVMVSTGQQSKVNKNLLRDKVNKPLRELLKAKLYRQTKTWEAIAEVSNSLLGSNTTVEDNKTSHQAWLCRTNNK